MNTLKIGQTVVIVNRSMSGRYMIEGRATLVQPTSQPEHWYVQFIGEQDTYRRYIDMAAQDNPDAYIAMLNN